MYSGFTDYYLLLKIPFSATGTEIKNAYRQMAKEYHPDLHPDDTEGFTQKFQQITAAYETLSDPVKKTNYDFLYRQVVLQEYQGEVYYVDPEPEDQRVYTHTYTARKKGKTKLYPILMFGVLLMQLISWLIKAAPVNNPDIELRNINTNFQEELLRMAKDSFNSNQPVKDTASVLFKNTRPVAPMN